MNQEPQIAFPEPIVIGRRKYWRRGALRGWEAAIAGQEAPELQSDDEMLLNSRQVRARYGGVSDMWLWRRRHPPTDRVNAPS